MGGEGAAADAGSMTIAGLTFRGTLHAREGRLFFEANPRLYDPANFDKLGALFTHGFPPSLSFDYQTKRPYDVWRAGLSMLRIGYLAAFAKFGYRYCFSPHLGQVQLQLLHPETEIVTGCFVDFGEDEQGGRPPWIGIFMKPQPCVLVRIGSQGVVLPWWSGPTWSYPFPGTPGDVQLSGGHHLTWPDGMEMIEDFETSQGWRLPTA